MANIAAALVKAGKTVVTKLGPVGPVVGVVAATGGLAGIGVGGYFIAKHYRKKRQERAKEPHIKKK